MADSTLARARAVFTADLTADDRRYPLYERLYALLFATFAVLLVLTNIIGVKLFQAPLYPSFALTTGIITYPMTFLITDLVSEIYGKRRADFMVLIGFLMSVMMVIIVQIAVYVPGHHFWSVGEDVATCCTTHEGYQDAFNAVFGLNVLLVVGSMAAYLSAQLTDNFLYHFWKRLTNGRHLWLRNNGSTWISQLVDTFIVNSLLFWGGHFLPAGFQMSFAEGVTTMLTIYVFKLVIAASDTPLIYLGVFVMKALITGSEQKREAA